MTSDFVTTIQEINENRGPGAVLEGMWIHALQHTEIADIVQALFGPTVREKLVAFPSLGYWPHLRSPRSFNEKILHRKLFTDSELFTTVSDKYAVREFVESTVGSEILTELYHVTEDPETIPFAELPNQYVIKSTQGSSLNIIVEDESEEDLNEIKRQCSEWLDKEYGAGTGEYWYTDISPKIIVEAFIEDDTRRVPLDYKFYVFDGRVEYVHVDFGRFSNHTRRFYDRDWNPQEFTFKYPLGQEVDEPDNLDGMIEVAEQLGEEFDFARVDLYNPTEDEIVFGEITLAPEAGHGGFSPTQYDFEFGSYWPDPTGN